MTGCIMHVHEFRELICAGYKWDMNYGKSHKEKRKAEANIREVGVPATDPVYGSKGPLIEHWQRSNRTT